MTLDDLTYEFRRITNDLAKPYFWTDPEIATYATMAEAEAARRALLLADSVDVDVVAGDTDLPMPAEVLLVRRVWLVTAERSLRLIGWRSIEETTPGWSHAAVATPTAAIPDWKSGSLRLYPTPSANDIAELLVVRLPKKALVEPTDTPEIAPAYHVGLIDGMLELAYAKHDADCFDPEASALYGSRFTATFGPAFSGVSETLAARDVSRARHEPPR